MRRPQHTSFACSDCEGSGVTQDEDFDEHGRHLTTVPCEGCEGSGSLTHCDRCDEVIALGEAELLGYVCGMCRAGLERGDAAAEMARIRRAS